MTPAQSNTQALLAAWITAKDAEDKARKERLSIEAQLEGFLLIPHEGSKTQLVGGYKATVTQPINYKLDVKRWAALCTKLPEDRWPVKAKLEADPSGCKYLRIHEPEVWKLVADAFTVTPGKLGFKIEERES